MPTPRIEALRRELREKFPCAHGPRPAAEDRPAAADLSFRPESFPAGAISEVIPAGPAAGLSLLVAALLGESEEESPHPELVLIDGADGFDPSSFTGATCSRLLWVRCTSALEMLKAADLLVRDGNVPFVMLDACGLSRRELAEISSSSWWRLRQLAGRGGIRLVVLAPLPIVPGASLRLRLSARLSLSDWDEPRAELLARMKAETRTLRHAT